MKVIQKKCPNCGAPLQFNEEDKVTVCGYCKQKVSIARKKTNQINEDYVLMVENHYKGRYYQEKVAKLVAIFIALIVALIMVFFLIKGLDNSKTVEEPPTTTKQYITEVSQIDSESLRQISSKSLDALGQNKVDGIPQTDWQSIGQYFLKHKENNSSNKIYDMYVKEYTIEGKTVRGYAGVEYVPLELSNENHLIIPYRGKSICPRNTFQKVVILGYLDEEDFYNQVIRNQTGDYIVSSTKNLYLEKING